MFFFSSSSSFLLATTTSSFCIFINTNTNTWRRRRGRTRHTRLTDWVSEWVCECCTEYRGEQNRIDHQQQQQQQCIGRRIVFFFFFLKCLLLVLAVGIAAIAALQYPRMRRRRRRRRRKRQIVRPDYRCCFRLRGAKMAAGDSVARIYMYTSSSSSSSPIYSAALRVFSSLSFKGSFQYGLASARTFFFFSFFFFGCPFVPYSIPPTLLYLSLLSILSLSLPVCVCVCTKNTNKI